MDWLLRYVIAILLFQVHACTSGFADETRTWTLDDFEDGDLKAASGVSWIVIADDLTGGATNVTLDLRPGGSGTSRHALRLSGRLGEGPGSFAGAWIPLERSGRNLDLRAFEGVRLRVKGPRTLDVGFRSGVVNFMARVEAGPDWTLVTVPFAQLMPTGKPADGAKWNPSAAQVFGVTTPQAPAAADRAAGNVAFEIDDVELYGTGTSPIEPAASGSPTGLAVAPFTKLSAIPSDGWVDLGSDPEGDGRFSMLPDATRLEAIPAAAGNMLWVRVTLRETPHDRWMGLNLAFDVDGDPANGFAWWGTNSGFKFDRIVTVWCFRVADGCQGYIGLADAAQAASGVFVAGGAETLRFAIDRTRRAFIVGVPRAALGPAVKGIRLVAAVGSALIYSDDVPGQGAAVVR